MSANNEGYDRDAALATLSPEELAALKEDEISEEDREVLQDIAGGEDEGADADADADDGDDDEEAGDEDDEGEDDNDAGAAAEDAGVAEARADIPAADDDDDSGLVYEVTLPEDFEDRVKALDARADELAAKFKAGDIEADEFIAENRKITDERATLDRLRTEVSVAERLNEQNQRHQWERKVRSFMKEVKAAEGIDYAGKPLLNSALDIKVKELAAMQENGDKPLKWFLWEAHRQVKVELGIVVANDKPDGGKPKPPGARKPPTDALPRTLAQVPGGDGPGDVGGDEFAELDRLTGEEYEMALAKLSPAQRQRYLEQA